MTGFLVLNLLSPLALAFALGVFAKFIKSELTIPKEFYTGMSIYLLLALGLKGGVELSRTTLGAIALPAAATIFLGAVTPVTSYLVLRKLGKFSVADSAGIAAHYGSVSAVTFIAAQQFVASTGSPAEGFMPTLLTLLESPGIHIALAIGAIQTARVTLLSPVTVSASGGDLCLAEAVTVSEGPHWTKTLREVLTARTMVLLVGGLVVGYLMGEHGWDSVKLFFDGAFKGILTLFLLEMGLLAGERLGDLKKVGWFLLLFGTAMPVLHGTLAVLLGHWVGLSVGGCTVLAAMAASASYIAAPPAVRMNLPDANPSYYLTLALAITFPFNLLIGIPLYYGIARHLVT
jgi:hypothetical protein